MKKKIIKSIEELALMIVLVMFFAWASVEFWNDFASYFVPSLANAKFIHGLAFIGLLNIINFGRSIVGITIVDKETEE